MSRWLARIHFVLSFPISVLIILSSRSIHPSYRMSWFRRFQLGLTLFLNSMRITTGTSYKTHLAMALKLLETAPDAPGDVIECGTWKGGTATNLSLICRIVNRKLIIYDSFEGLPPPVAGDREGRFYQPGDYRGTLDEVKSNIGRYGALDRCEFVKGWFKDTLPYHHTPVLLAYVDVDLEDSLDTCVRHIWPRLVERGYFFIDEVAGLDYCALFYSEKYWLRHFGRTPPGLIGAGVGLPLGDYYIGPWDERDAHPTQRHNTGAYTRKDMSGHWAYYPDEA